jgi:hypothetical protein
MTTIVPRATAQNFGMFLFREGAQGIATFCSRPHKGAGGAFEIVNGARNVYEAVPCQECDAAHAYVTQMTHASARPPTHERDRNRQQRKQWHS